MKTILLVLILALTSLQAFADPDKESRNIEVAVTWQGGGLSKTENLNLTLNGKLTSQAFDELGNRVGEFIKKREGISGQTNVVILNIIFLEK